MTRYRLKAKTGRLYDPGISRWQKLKAWLLRFLEGLD